MDDYSYIGNSSPEAIEHLYKQYLIDENTVSVDWKNFFKGFEFAQKNFAENNIQSEVFDKEFKVLNLIDGYRKRGHLFTLTNPVRSRRKYTPTLDLEEYGLSNDDLDLEFHAGTEICIGRATLRKIVDHLKATYCQSIGVEFMFIRDAERLQWLHDRMEISRNTPNFKNEDKKLIFDQLKTAVGFERFIHKKFVGQKRFSLEGTETLIPALHEIAYYGADLGIKEFVVGMSHRGRLNVLTNFLGKPYKDVFQEYTGKVYEEQHILGDVKYHLGYDNDIITNNGKKVRLNLVPNPSHLEAVGPIVQGIARSRVDFKYGGDYKSIAPIIIHGDAAIAGQGVVYEVIQMAELQGYKTGGTLHLVINNQVGFTTNYLDARSSTYCTDIAKVTKAPIFHVNGDDVEALVFTIQMAVEYRQKFHSDVFIDILSYRKFGHNEGDEPRFTQPLLYKIIANHPNPRDIYGQKLIEQGVYTKEELEALEKEFDDYLEVRFEESKKVNKVKIKHFLANDWKEFKYSVHEDFNSSPQTGVNKKDLLSIADKLTHLPKEMKFFSKTEKLLKEREKETESEVLSWAMAELLAYGSLVLEGHPVRVSGQDSVRGTFSHRHAAHVIEDSDQQYIPLQHVSDSQAPFSIYNSPLNEYGVLGFEYGYALATPKALTIWEAQFGDFHNVAQVIIDQYVSSAEEKWGLMNGLVMLLPHGYEGQGPEHSSARIERFMVLAANDNMQLVNCTTPANFFHVLRRQMHRNFRIPLVVFTPKSLLRHPACTSPMSDLVNGKFMEVIDDVDVDIPTVRRVVFCSGKIYYDLLARKQKFNARDIALVRIEQLYPMPVIQINDVIQKYNKALIHLWVQEEPENMGAWSFINYHFNEIALVSVSRLPSGSPAVGLSELHVLGQEEIIDKVFRRCDCERNNKYCGLECVVGKSRKEILKQHNYIFRNQKFTVI